MADRNPPPAADAQTTPPAPPKHKKRRLLRVLIVGVVAIVVLLAVLIALLPTLLSTNAGTGIVKNVITGVTDGGTVELEDLSLAWGGPTRVTGLRIQDKQGRDVVLIGELSIESGVWSLARGAMASEFHLGDTYARGKLPLVEVYDDGTTNLHEVFPVLFAPSDEPPPKVYGNFRLDFGVTVQHMGDRAIDTDNGPPVDLELADATAALQPGQPLQHDLPIAFRVNAQPAGAMALVGTIDLDAATPTVAERVTLNNVNLTAITPLLAAFGVEYALDGTANGNLDVDSGKETLAGAFTFDGFKLTPIAGGEGFESSVVKIEIEGAFPGMTVAQIDALTLTTDDGTATLGANVELAALESEKMVELLMAVKDVSVNVDTPFLTMKGEGASLGGLDLTYTSDLGQLRERFGDLVSPGGLQSSGIVTGRVLTQVKADVIQARIDANAANLQLIDTSEAGVAASKPPLNLASFESSIIATLAGDGETQSIPTAKVTLSASDATGPIFTTEIDATNISADTQSIEKLTITSLSLPDYARAQNTLAGWVELPIATGEPGPITVAGSLKWDGPTQRVEIIDPVIVSADGVALANVTGNAAMPAEGNTTANLTLDIPDMQALNTTLAAFDKALSGSQPPAGRMRAEVDVSLDPDAAETMQGLTGTGNVELVGTSLEGLQLDGTIPIRIESGLVTIPPDSAPLTANTGNLSLAGLSLDLNAMRLTLPEGALVEGVMLNPVLTNALGQYINPVLTEPEDASGLLNVQVTRAANLNLNDLLGTDGGQMTIVFNVRQFNLDNDVIGSIADQLTGQLQGSVRNNLGLLAAAPKIGEDVKGWLAALDVNEEVKEEISSFTGDIANSTVAIDNGVASTEITFNVFDPRLDATAASLGPDDRYVVTFAGQVDLNTKNINLSTNIPVNLIEKWIGDEPGDLVDLLGEKPFQKALPNGVTVHFSGTSYVPIPDIGQTLQAVVPGVMRQIATKKAADLLPPELRGLGDLLKGL